MESLQSAAKAIPPDSCVVDLQICTSIGRTTSAFEEYLSGERLIDTVGPINEDSGVNSYSAFYFRAYSRGPAPWIALIDHSVRVGVAPREEGWK